MLKQLIACIFLIAFALQTFSRAFIVLDYMANTAAFAKNCENKAMPAMHCNGKCQMMKKLKQEEKKDQQNPERKSENKNEIALSSRSFFPALELIASVQQIDFHPFTPGKPVSIPYSLLRPPAC